MFFFQMLVSRLTIILWQSIQGQKFHGCINHDIVVEQQAGPCSEILMRLSYIHQTYGNFFLTLVGFVLLLFINKSDFYSSTCINCIGTSYKQVWGQKNDTRPYLTFILLVFCMYFTRILLLIQSYFTTLSCLACVHKTS